jgi:hypothetical protein
MRRGESMSLNFTEIMMPVKRHSVMKEEDYYVWGATQVRHTDEKYYLIYSRWPKSAGFEGWVSCCELGWAVSDSPLGPWEKGGIALAGSENTTERDESKKHLWDAHCIHNPTMIPYEGKYYLYYMANYGNGEYWNHRNNQRIGVAVADHPAGPWKRSEAPVIDVTPGSHDHLMTSNPTVAVRPDGGILMVYKAVGDNNGLRPQGGPVVCGVAQAAHPLGPFKKHPIPVMINPEHDWSVEDPYIWYQEDRYYALVKDFQGYFAHHKHSVALFESLDGIDWNPAEHANAFDRRITWEEGEEEELYRMERPQILLDERGRSQVLLCAVTRNEDDLDTWNVQIPLKKE